MTKNSKNARLGLACVVQQSSHVSLLFFAFVLFASSASVAQESSGWNVNSKSNAETQAPPALELTEEEAVQAQQDAEAAIEQKAEERAIEEQALLEQEAQLQQGEPALVNGISLQPIINLDPDLRESLELQFQQIQSLLETEDAYSEQLGESYLSYGNLLQRAGRLDEARGMFVNALHIAKVNNGVTSLEQRPILRSLFELHYARGETDEIEDLTRRIIWLEKKYPESSDDYTFDIALRLGNHFLDLYLFDPVVSEQNLVRLSKATNYFRYTVVRYGNAPISEKLMPYGELAYTHFLKSRIQDEVNRSYYREKNNRTYGQLDKLDSSHSLANSFVGSDGYLKQYLTKAQSEEDVEHTVQALLNLGDLNLLYGRRVGASKYYELAWLESQKLAANHPLVLSFDEPVQLPAFRFSLQRENFRTARLSESIPMVFDIDTDGFVKKLSKNKTEGYSNSVMIRARRAAKRLRFRPIIENGKLLPSPRYTHNVKVAARNLQADARR